MNLQHQKRFWTKVRIGELDECWPWIAKAKNEHGYGLFHSWESRNAVRKAHRVAFLFAYGYEPTLLRHTCDNPPCCNPRHLIEGTQLENVRDMHDRNRQSVVGERNGMAKLTNRQVIEIHQRVHAGERGIDLAREYGVSKPTITRIKLLAQAILRELI